MAKTFVRVLNKPSSVPHKRQQSFIWTYSYLQAQATQPGRFRGPHHPFPIWSCSMWGLPKPASHLTAGALLPHLSTLTDCSAVFFSMTLSRRSPLLDVIQHAALWSPDFPQVPQGHQRLPFILATKYYSEKLKIWQPKITQPQKNLLMSHPRSQEHPFLHGLLPMHYSNMQQPQKPPAALSENGLHR